MRGGLNYGIDFVGGTIVEIKFQAPVDIAAVRAALGPAGFGGAEIKHFGSPSEVLISTEQSSTSVEGVEKADPRRSRQPLERAVRRAAPRDGRPEGRRRPAQQGDLVADRLLGADARLHHLALRVQVRGRRHPRARARRHHLGRDLHAARPHLQPDGARRGADDRRLLDQRHDRHLRPDPRAAQDARASGRSARSSTSR